jgi:putative protease
MTTELLAPAGTLKSMRYAFAYGADAVYAGQPRYSLRVRNNEFNKLDVLRTACDEAHAQGKKFYLASNLSPHNNKVRTYLRDLEPVIEMRPDALIMSDPGLIMLVRQAWPEQAIHLSVQANAVNYATVQFWQRQGIERVILSRELALDEIEEIRQQCPDMELEVFVHGALCIAYSGRCLLSGYMAHRDSNQGACTNSCRWQYNAHPATENELGDLIASAPAPHPESSSAPGELAVLLQEQNRPGEFMPAYEDEHGTYIMNSKDLRAVQHVERLVKMGIHSLKIEGRTKSFYYVGRTTQAYRKAIDDAQAGRPFDATLMGELDHLANRGYTDGFYQRHGASDTQNYDEGISVNRRQQFVGEVLSYEPASGWLTVKVKNKMSRGERLDIITPRGNQSLILDTMENLEGQPMDVAPGDGHTVRIALASPMPIPEDGAYTLIMSHRL